MQRGTTMISGNPFREKSNDSSPPEDGGRGAQTIAEAIKKDDAAMAKQLAVLSRRPEAKPQTKKTVSIRGGAATCPVVCRNGRGLRTVEIKEVHSTEMFIAKKRDVGLMRLALANKEAEIRHLEEEMDRAEKRLRQQQEQLASTEEKFNNFLKHSNLEQDAAVRRAEVESKAKLERLIDIKKLSAQISHMEQDMRKTDVQLELCMEYKNFMDSLTEPQWFYDVLCGLRVNDISQVILRETEEKYTRRAEELTEAVKQAAARRESRQRRIAAARERGTVFLEPGRSGERDDGTLEEDEEEEVSLEVQLEKLHQDLEAEAQRQQEEATASIKREVESLSVDEVRAVLDKAYPQERIPMYFTEPDQILDIFINVEEGNLFLIQNSQELEEELERVAMEYFSEQEEMSTMVRQRSAQMESLATRIKEAQQRLSQLEARLLDLESIDSGADAGDDAARNKNGVGSPRRDKAGTVMRQEVLKRLIERAVADIFRCISQQQTTAARRPEDSEGAEDAMQSGGRAKSLTGQKRASQFAVLPKNKGKKKERTVTGSATAGGVDAPNDADAGANMWPVEMLTIIENKIDEYIRYINDPENGVEQSLIMSVIKIRDKERRHQARVVQLERQSIEREERNRRALERSQAPVVRRRGKPIMWRSRPPVETAHGTEVKQGPVTTKEADQDEEFFR
ncbi:flagellar associated protein [Trypanosoma conorhini]|uniref:Flagellar associated protein n=1 Tax=Trypanosoma conorhini TaxID=83891 RepID=A0A3R7NPP1_9TRYP|nr:flagellar associated protein [Trypanosoma conorhini]RNF25112.1 flagellar associated protein [Trypanosoma conorhini]